MKHRGPSATTELHAWFYVKFTIGHFFDTCVSLLSRRSWQRERLSASVLSICSFVCLSVAKMQKTRFSKTISNLELWSLLTTYRKSYMTFSKNPLLDPENPRRLRSAILKIDMMSFFSAVGGPIWIKFRRLVQNDMSTAVMVEIEINCRIPIWRTFWRIQWHVIPEPELFSEFPRPRVAYSSRNSN